MMKGVELLEFGRLVDCEILMLLSGGLLGLKTGVTAFSCTESRRTVIDWVLNWFSTFPSSISSCYLTSK